MERKSSVGGVLGLITVIAFGIGLSNGASVFSADAVSISKSIATQAQTKLSVYRLHYNAKSKLNICENMAGKHGYNEINVMYLLDHRLAGECADLSGAHLRFAKLRVAYLSGANLSHADLLGADLRGAQLNGADLRGANLSESDLRLANLVEADLRGADLRGADLHSANLRGAKLRGAIIRGATMDADNLQLAKSRGARD